jgi:thiamine biosynthesis lipoprotein
MGGAGPTAGAAPAGGWRVHVTDDHRSPASAPGQTVAIRSGGLATSSTTVRRWRRETRGRLPWTRETATMHHILDPRTGAPARTPWRTASVAAASCAEANIASTAALVRGEAAPSWLARLGLPARLVARDGATLRVGAWPVPAQERET